MAKLKECNTQSIVVGVELNTFDVILQSILNKDYHLSLVDAYGLGTFIATQHIELLKLHLEYADVLNQEIEKVILTQEQGSLSSRYSVGKTSKKNTSLRASVRTFYLSEMRLMRNEAIKDLGISKNCFHQALFRLSNPLLLKAVGIPFEKQLAAYKLWIDFDKSHKLEISFTVDSNCSLCYLNTQIRCHLNYTLSYDNERYLSLKDKWSSLSNEVVENMVNNLSDESERPMKVVGESKDGYIISRGKALSNINTSSDKNKLEYADIYSKSYKGDEEDIENKRPIYEENPFDSDLSNNVNNVMPLSKAIDNICSILYEDLNNIIRDRRLYTSKRFSNWFRQIAPALPDLQSILLHGRTSHHKQSPSKFRDRVVENVRLALTIPETYFKYSREFEEWLCKVVALHSIANRKNSPDNNLAELSQALISASTLDVNRYERGI